MKSKVITDEKWGQIAKIEKGDIELKVLLDKGPRIISFKYKGRDNIFFEDINDAVNVPREQLAVFGENEGWHIYGGHRFWVAPETNVRTYYPDNNKVDFKAEGNKFIFTAEIEKWNNLQKQLTIKFADDGVEVVHSLTNCGPFEIECSLWASTAVKTGGVEIIPQNEKYTGLAANTALSVWPYTHLNDSRFHILDSYFLIEAAKDTEPFKIGYFCEKGYAAYLIDGVLFKKQFKADANAKYPSFNSNFETYTCENMLEMESVGETVKIQPKQTVTHTEIWSAKLCKDTGALNDETIKLLSI